MIKVGFVIRPRSAYLHIPFCHRRCFYCDFAVVPLGDKAGMRKGPGSNTINSYLKLLHREIDLAPKGSPLSTVYIGGGTPSLLRPEQIGSLLQHLRSHFGFQPDPELTLEVDPASFDEEALNGFLKVGINRLSLGGQSFDNKTLEKLGRRHKSDDLLRACELIASQFSAGNIRTWSLDLLQNLPGQEINEWENQLNKAIETSAPHLSIYDLSIEPGTVFQWRLNRGEISLPSEEISIEINNLTNSILKKSGFARYEISNYALPGHTSRHNRVYWSGGGWWAFGQGATSSPWGERLARPRTRASYETWLKSQERDGVHSSMIKEKAIPMSLDERLIVGLRRREGINFNKLSEIVSWDKINKQDNMNLLKIKLEKWIENDYINFYGDRLFLNDPKGMEVSNQILIDVLLWWECLETDYVCQPIP